MGALLIAPPEPRLDPHGVAIIGAGPFARAIAQIVVASGARPRVFVRRLGERPELSKGLGQAELSDDLPRVLDGARLVVFAVPAGELEDIATRAGPHLMPDQVALVVSRGLTEGFLLPHEHLRRQTCLRQIGVLGGPLNIAELEAGRRLNVVIATRYRAVLEIARHFTSATRVSFEPTRDLIGVSIAGAIANVASIAAGLAEALELGATARGVLQARGVFEATRLGTAHGAEASTFGGLAGLGELIPRDVRSMERHEELGRALATMPLSAAMEKVGGHVEGVLTAQVASERARQRGLELPLVQGLQAVMSGEDEARKRLDSILVKPLAEGRG